MRDLKLFKNQNWRNYLQNGVKKDYFQNQGMREWKVTRGPFSCMPKVAMQTGDMQMWAQGIMTGLR